MRIEYLTDQEIISWGTVFQYDTRDNLFANSGLDSWVTYPYTNFNYGNGSNDLGFISPLNGGSAVLIDIDVADESEYTASNVIVKFRRQAGGSVTVDQSTGQNIRSGEIEGINLRGFERSPSSKQTQVIVPLNDNGTFDYSYEVTGELPLLRHIKIVGKISEFDIEALQQGTKISQLPFTDTQIDDMFVVSRCEDDASRKFIESEGGGNSIPDFADNSRNYNASYAVSLYHLKQGLGVGAHCTVILTPEGEIDTVQSCMINCFVEKGNTAGAFIVTTTNGLYKDKQVTVLASSSAGTSATRKEGGFIAVEPPTFSRDTSVKVLPPIAGQQQAEAAYNASVEITQYTPAFNNVGVIRYNADDKKDSSSVQVLTEGDPNAPEEYTPYAIYVSFIGK